MDWLTVEPLRPGRWRIVEGGFVAMYLVAGRDGACLIDTGLGVTDVRRLAVDVCGQDVVAVTTHAHHDHVGGNAWFDRVLMSRVEWEVSGRRWNERLSHIADGEWHPSHVIQMLWDDQQAPDSFDPRAYDRHIARGLPEPERLLDDGDTIDLGGTVLEAVVAPSHTSGSLCLLDRQARELFAGDVVGDGNVWLHLRSSPPPEECLRTYERLAAMAENIDTIHHSHPSFMLSGEYLVELRDRVRDAVAGRLPTRRVRNAGGRGIAHRAARLNIVLPREDGTPSRGRAADL
jgi:glyoxylase-like metal-dependent hydrolase (beta-lactamase superfamily II)